MEKGIEKQKDVGEMMQSVVSLGLMQRATLWLGSSLQTREVKIWWGSTGATKLGQNEIFKKDELDLAEMCRMACVKGLNWVLYTRTGRHSIFSPGITFMLFSSLEPRVSALEIQIQSCQSVSC